MGKLIFLGVTAYLAIRYITRPGAKQIDAPAPQPEALEPAAPMELPPASK